MVDIGLIIGLLCFGAILYFFTNREYFFRKRENRLNNTSNISHTQRSRPLPKVRPIFKKVKKIVSVEDRLKAIEAENG